jgi:hypothetical protein
MKKITEAQNTACYRLKPVFEQIQVKNNGVIYRKAVITDYQIEKTTLYYHITESADQTTTPNGVANRLHIRKNDDESAEIWTWGFRGNHPTLVSKYKTEDEAEQELFDMIYQNDFFNDDQRDCSWFETEAEAIAYQTERLAVLWNVNFDVAASILRKKQNLENHRAQQAAKRSLELKKTEQELAAGYENIIEFIPGERYDDTCARLSSALNPKPNGQTFHAIVRTLRRQWLKIS